MANFDIAFLAAGTGAVGNNIGIGQPAGSGQRLAVLNNATGLSGAAEGVNVTVNGNNPSNTGIIISSFGSPNTNVGLGVNATGGTTNYAIRSSNGDVQFHAISGNSSFGPQPPLPLAKVRILPTAGNTNALLVQNIGIGVDALRIDAANGQNNIDASVTPSASQAGSDLVVQGNVWINGTGYYPGAVVITSDQAFKTNIDSISNALSIIKQLKPHKFFYDTLNTYGINFSGKRQYGLISQEVQTVLPELVENVNKSAVLDSIGNVIIPSVNFKSLNYNAFIALLMKGMQEQQKTIDAYKAKDSIQDARLAALEAAINTCCANANVRTNNSNTLNQTNIELSDKEIIVLNQNVPNPFAEQTTITYNVPEKYGFAQIIFNTSDGRIIKTVDLTKKGRGQLTVFANDLSNGMYAYSLVVDGKVVDTKKMVKQ